MRKARNSGLFASTALTMLLSATGTYAAEKDGETLVLEEITVTARQRSESLQDVPDAVTAFSAVKIERAGIDSLQGYVNQTPNFIARQGFRAGVTFITIRGITTGQQGFAPISYTVDGVKAGMLDAVNPGLLFDLERIEVLRGPQGALYGAGAIAGAVNIITKKPGNEFSGEIKASYGKGNDKLLKGTISGPIVEDTLAFRLTGLYRNTDGLTKSTTGDNIDFMEQASIKGRLLYTPNEDLSFDLRATYTDISAGAAAQERFETLDQVNKFDKANFSVDRGIIGKENRESIDLSAKIDIELPFATLRSVTSYVDLEQNIFGSVSFDRPPSLGEAPGTGLFGPILGANAGPGEVIDQFQDLADNFEVFFQDIRFISNSDSSLRWLVGAEYMRREVVNKLDVGLVLAPAPGTNASLFDRYDGKSDKIFGIYGQVNVDVTDKLELTVAGRYDQDNFTTRQFEGDTGNTILSQNDSGALVDKLTARDSKFQPKVQLSYDWSDDLMTYATFAQGFRFGFFNTGARTKAESTKNYELGFKASLADNRLTLNGAIFHIDYSDQQLTSIIAEPPFRETTNIPSTNINGVELEMAWIAADGLEITGGLGYLDAKISGTGVTPDGVPKWTTNLGIQYIQPVSDDMDMFAHADWRYQGGFVINDTFQFNIHGVNLVNLRLGLEGENWSLTAYMKNALNERYATDPGFLGSFIRSYNKPRSYGVELGYKF